MDTQLEESFNAACDYVAAAVTSREPGFTDSIKLQLYGLYKQATVGPCDSKQPGFWNPSARLKWDAWHKLGNLPTSEAMQQYIAVLSTVAPSWSGRSTASAPEDADMQDEASTSSSAQAGGAGSSTKASGLGGGFGPVFSMFAHVDDDDDADSDQAGANQLHILAGEGDEAALSALLQTAGTRVDERDDEGCTALHFAADRGQAGTAQLLLAAGADVNAQDNDGASPLHYATLCGNSELAALLVEHGADPHLLDSSGKPAMES